MLVLSPKLHYFDFLPICWTEIVQKMYNIVTCQNVADLFKTSIFHIFVIQFIVVYNRFTTDYEAKQVEFGL